MSPAKIQYTYCTQDNRLPIFHEKKNYNLQSSALGQH